MPKTRTKKPVGKSQRRTKSKRANRSSQTSAPKRESTPSKLSFILDSDNEPTHVIMPYEEYERMLMAEMAASAIDQLYNSTPEDYVDADDVAIEFARDEIVAARKKAKLTQKELGAKLGMPQSQISRIERNPDRTHVRTLRKLAKALNVDVSVFLKHL